MITTCKVCGKRFNAKQRNYVICSSECRLLYSRRRYSLDPKFRVNHKKYYQTHYVHKQKPCEVCGKILPDAHQMYCVDCILNMYLYGDRTKAVHILSCRGYDKSMIQDLIDEKGIKL